jgi:hypothetical protein
VTTGSRIICPPVSRAERKKEVGLGPNLRLAVLPLRSEQLGLVSKKALRVES